MNNNLVLIDNILCPVLKKGQFIMSWSRETLSIYKILYKNSINYILSKKFILSISIPINKNSLYEESHFKVWKNDKYIKIIWT